MNKYIFLINDWMERKERLIETDKKVKNNLISNYQLLQADLIEINKKRFNELLIKCKEKFTEHQKNQLIESTDFNCLEYFNISETIHSSLLGDLLSSNSSHGQGDLFLNIFLTMLELPDFEKGKWIVETEKNNVDIVLTRREKNNIVIIENKSNNAIDQPNQLYRYWYYNIYQKFKSQFPKENLPIILPHQFKIIYLVPNNWKKPESHSLTKPEWLHDESAPEKLPIEWISIWKYNLQINNLIVYALNGINENNHRLRQYLIQYRDIIRNLN